MNAPANPYDGQSRCGIRLDRCWNVTGVEPICTHAWFFGAAWTAGGCWLWLLTHKVVTSLAVPLALILVGGGLQVLMTHEWRLDHFF
jgi:hypothetical protein